MYMLPKDIQADGNPVQGKLGKMGIWEIHKTEAEKQGHVWGLGRQGYGEACIDLAKVWKKALWGQGRGNAKKQLQGNKRDSDRRAYLK